MKHFFILLFTLGLLGLAVPATHAAGVSAPRTSAEAVEAPTALSKKELRQQRRMEKQSARISKWMSKFDKNSTTALDRYLRLAILCAVGAVVLSIIAGIIIFIPGAGGFLATLIWSLASIAWLAGVVFFVLWLIEEVI